MKYISNKYCIWEDEKGKRYKLKKVALLMESGKKFVEQRHYVRSLYRQNIKPNAVIIYKDVIIDGTHRNASLYFKRRQHKNTCCYRTNKTMKKVCFIYDGYSNEHNLKVYSKDRRLIDSGVFKGIVGTANENEADFLLCCRMTQAIT